MQDNALHGMIEGALKRADTSNSLTAKAVSFGAQALMPVRKVPLNYLQEIGEHAIGGANAYPLLRRAIKEGVDKLSPEEKDYVMRNLTRQTVGAALAVIAYAGAGSFGGLYNKKEDYESRDHPQPGDIKVGDTTINHRLAHIPALEYMQMIANFAHPPERGVGRTPGLLQPPLYNTAKIIPFIDQLRDLARVLRVSITRINSLII